MFRNAAVCCLLVVLVGCDSDGTVSPPTPIRQIPRQFAPSWSEHGRIAYISHDVPNMEDGLYTSLADGSERRLILAGRLVAAPDWHPDGDRILFTSNQSGIYTIKPDGSELFGYSTTSPSSFFGRWSRDGARLAYDVTLPVDSNGVWTASADDNRHTQTASGRFPDWPHSGDSLVFVALHHQLFVSDTTGADPRQLTFNSWSNWHPSWSPTRDLIAWSSQEGPSRSIWVMKTDGSDQRRLASLESTDDTNFDRPRVDWTPTGDSLVFSWLNDDKSVAPLHIMSLAGETPRPLFNN